MRFSSATPRVAAAPTVAAEDQNAVAGQGPTAGQGQDATGTAGGTGSGGQVSGTEAAAPVLPDGDTTAYITKVASDRIVVDVVQVFNDDKAVKAAIADGKPRMLEFGVADETAWRVGLSCGGRIRVYVERVD